MEDLGLDFDRALDRVGDETVLFGFFQDARHARQIVGGRDHDSRFHNDFGDLIAAARNLLELSLSRRR